MYNTVTRTSDRRTSARLADHERWLDAAQLRTRQEWHRRRRITPRRFRSFSLLREPITKRGGRRAYGQSSRPTHVLCAIAPTFGSRSSAAVGAGEKIEKRADRQTSIGRQRKHWFEDRIEPLRIDSAVEIHDRAVRRFPLEERARHRRKSSGAGRWQRRMQRRAAVRAVRRPRHRRAGGRARRNASRSAAVV